MIAGRLAGAFRNTGRDRIADDIVKTMTAAGYAVRENDPFTDKPQPFGFSIDYTDGSMNLRSYYPDFVAVDDKGTCWLLESKGAETGEVIHKDGAATQWCENATTLTGTKWRYLKVQQKAFEMLQPTRFGHLAALRPATLF